MRGVNVVCLGGNVSTQVQYGTTSEGYPCCGFSIIVERDRVESREPVTTVVRVNVFVAALVQVCRLHVRKGVYVVVQGELMNRRVDGTNLLEVRAREVIVMTRFSGTTEGQ
jgi:single-stranded DNA-binding protein